MQPNFTSFWVNLKDFVDNLVQLVPVPFEAISNIIKEDIVSTIDIGTLRLIKSGCDKDSYPQWSARASEAISESAAGSVDRRNITEMLRDTGAIEGMNSMVDSEASNEGERQALQNI